jgi:glycosyltransferase involved in cell wall biosynthesis
MAVYGYYEADTRVMMYAEALAKRGDDVEIFALGYEGVPPQDFLRGVKIFRIQRRQRNEKNPFSYFIKIGLFFFRTAFWLTVRHLRHRYDVVHIHSMPDFLVFAALILRLMGTKLILDIHDLLPEMYAERFKSKHSLLVALLRAQERISCRFSHHVISANHLWFQKLTARSVPCSRCSVFLNYPDRTIFKRSTLQPKGNRFVFIYPGTLHWHQGLEVAVLAMPAVRAQAPQALLRIFGLGPELPKLQSLVQELHLECCVEFKGFIPTDMMPNILEEADVGIVPKRKDSFGNEAFSTKILEFMSFGIPVICSDTKIDKYYFNDSVVKFFASGDEKSLANAMLDLIRTPNEAHALAARASTFVEGFNWEKRKHEYFALLDSLCKKR